MRVKPYSILGLIAALFLGAGARTGKSSDQTGHRNPARTSIERKIATKAGSERAAKLASKVAGDCGDAAAVAEFSKSHWWLSAASDKTCTRSLSPLWREICKVNPGDSSDKRTDEDLLDPKLNGETFIPRCLGRSPHVLSMMASVPNPRRTHLGLMTDRAIEALQVAAAETDFLPLSHYLPWPSPPSGPAVAPEPDNQLDSSDPGVLVFRHSTQLKHLMIFLIPELPTEGLDGQVFTRAQQIIEKVSPGLSIIPFDGPNFSGSGPSLRSLDQGLGKARCIRAISGSVTNPEPNQQPKTGCPPTLTVLQTKDEEALKAFVKAAHAFRYDCRQIAILAEEGTQYGAQSTLACPQGKKYGALSILHFPREISKLRNAYGAEAGKSPPPSQLESTVRPDLGLQWQDVDAAQRDDLQTYGGQQTPLSQETVLSSLSITLKAQGIKALGILATDPLDEAFLIHSIKKSSPDIRLFLRDPDLLFLRTPDVASLNGTLLVSDYPLIPQNQFWSSTKTKFERLITFPSAFQEGVYNSFIQLAEDSEWGVAPGQTKRLEWNWPAGSDAKANAPRPATSDPPLWLATIGTAGHYPVNILYPDKKPELEIKKLERELQLHSLNLGPPQFSPMAFWSLIAFLGIVHAVGLKFGAVVHSYFKRDFDLSDQTNTVTMVKAFCHMMALLTITLAQLILGSSYVFFYRSGWQFTCLACAVVSATAFLVGMTLRQVRLLYTLQRQQSRLAVPDERSKIVAPKQIFRTSLIALAIMGGAGVFWVVVTLHTGFGNAFLHFRDLNLSSGVAPNLPLAAVLMVMYFGVWAYLRRLSYWEHRYVAMFDLKLDKTIRQDFKGDIKAIDACLLGPLENRKWMAGFWLMLGASILAFRPWITLDMIEPSGVWGFALFLFFLALLTLWLNWFRFINVWVHLRNILERLENLPIRIAFERLPREKSLPILHWGSSQNTFLLRQVLDRMRALAHADPTVENQRLKEDFETSMDSLMRYGVVETEVMQLRKVSGGAPRSVLRPLSRSLYELRRAARDEMTKLTEILSERLLEEYWERGSTSSKSESSKPDVQGSTPDAQPKPQDLKYVLAEDIVALPIYAYIHKVLDELRNMLFFLGIAISLLFAALHTYAFRADQSIDWWFFGLFAFMGGGIVFVIADMDRNALISRLSDEKPGELGRGFYLELLKYGTVPFLTIFGSQVPSISNLLLKWVQPALEALH